jgi:hypothetical protein
LRWQTGRQPSAHLNSIVRWHASTAQPRRFDRHDGCSDRFVGMRFGGLQLGKRRRLGKPQLRTLVRGWRSGAISVPCGLGMCHRPFGELRVRASAQGALCLDLGLRCFGPVHPLGHAVGLSARLSCAGELGNAVQHLIRRDAAACHQACSGKPGASPPRPSTRSLDTKCRNLRQCWCAWYWRDAPHRQSPKNFAAGPGMPMSARFVAATWSKLQWRPGVAYFLRRTQARSVPTRHNARAFAMPPTIARLAGKVREPVGRQADRPIMATS